MFKRFGTDVTIFEMLPRIVPVEDEESPRNWSAFQEAEDSRRDRRASAANIQKTADGV